MITAEAVIDLGALRHNMQVLSAYQPDSRMIAVLKGNAYGHGSLAVAHALHGLVDSFAVARIEEAIELREAGIQEPIVLLEGCFSLEETQQAAALNLESVVQNDLQINWLSQISADYRTNLWLKVDTGMHRLGFSPEQIGEKYHQLAALPVVKNSVGFVSHFSQADTLTSERTNQQVAIFEQATLGLIGPRSIANSAALLTRRDISYDKARPGIALYGVSPFEGQCGEEHQLKPVMTLRSKLIAVREHQQGEPVGYGGLWTAAQNTMLGVVAMGYGDGYPRAMPSGTPVMINGRRVPIVGRVSMDMITVDLGTNACDQVGDEVILWGPNHPVETLAERVNTIGYELLIQLTARVKRTYINP